AESVAARVRESGLPNYFGDQRFGRDYETLRLGLELLRGTREPGQIPRARRKFLLRLALSSVQSALFNRTVATRLTAGTLFRVRPGDVMQVVATGGPFVVEDVDREQPRFEARETVIAGPMFGPKMKPAGGEVAAWEDQLLAGAGLSRDEFTRFPQLTSGTRRACLVWPDDLRATQVESGVQFEFSLPSGSYATVLLRELMKAPPGQGS
ncbi:MAG: tRNA pseudouridine(13) synthase TruD, partial [Planctomycetaceae bacterium]